MTLSTLGALFFPLRSADGLAPSRHTSGVLACRLTGRIQIYRRHVSEGDAPRSLVLVPVLINPGPPTRGERAQAKAAAAFVPEQCFLLAFRAAHLCDAGLGEAPRLLRSPLSGGKTITFADGSTVEAKEGVEADCF